MSELTILTAAFAAVASPLFLAVFVIGAGDVRNYRRQSLLRRAGAEAT